MIWQIFVYQIFALHIFLMIVLFLFEVPDPIPFLLSSGWYVSIHYLIIKKSHIFIGLRHK